jgi:ADP-ribose pyrophosphatase YjhB (NUDIX family)
MQERRVNARGIIYKGGKLFAQQLKANAGPHQFWSTPGGGLDPGESLKAGLYREMIEETGIAPAIGKLLFIQQFHDGTREQLEFFFHIENADDYAVIDLSATSHGEIEVAVNKFIEPTIERLLPVFLKNVDFNDYIENHLPVLVMSELSL